MSARIQKKILSGYLYKKMQRDEKNAEAWLNMVIDPLCK